MKKVLYFFIFMILCPILVFADSCTNNLTTYEMNGSTQSYETEYLKYLKSTAKSYLNKGEAIQYDFNLLTFNGSFGDYGSQRIGYYFSPEEASNQYPAYTICSNFAFQLFYNTFSKGNTPYVINGNKNVNTSYLSVKGTTPYMVQISNPTSSEFFNEDLAVFYIDSSTYYNNGSTTKPSYFINGKNPTVGSSGTYDTTKAAALRSDLMNVVRPGDVIVYRVGSTGHAFIYLGDNEIVESYYTNDSTTGAYDFENKVDKRESASTLNAYNYDGSVNDGTIHTWKLNKCNTDSVDKSMFGYNTEAFGDYIEAISVIRPFNEMKNNNYVVSQNAMARDTLSGLIMEKEMLTEKNFGKYPTVNLGDRITFKIKFKNKSNTAYTVNIKDEAPRGTVFENYCATDCTAINQNLTINANSEKEFIYTLFISNDFTDDYIEMDKTTVNGLKLTTTTAYIGNTLSEVQLNDMVTRSNTPASNFFEYINYIYANVGIQFDNFNTIMNSVFVINNNPTNNNDYNFKSVNGVTGNGPVKLCGTGENCFEGIYNTTSLEKNKNFDIYWPKKKSNDNKYTKMIVPGMYGGLLTLDNFYKTEGKTTIDFVNDPVVKRRITTISRSDLMDGDIILVNCYANSSGYSYSNDAFIYLNNSLKYIESGTVKAISGQDADNLLNEFIGELNFVILRPSNSLITNGGSENPDTGVGLTHIIIPSILLVSLLIIYFINKRTIVNID